MLVPTVKTNFSISSEEGTERLVCIPRIVVGANLEVVVTSLMKKTLRACNWRLTICEGSYAVSDIGEPLQVMAPFWMMIVIKAIAPGLGLFLVSPFRVIKITIIGRERRVHLTRAWAMMLWAGL